MRPSKTLELEKKTNNKINKNNKTKSNNTIEFIKKYTMIIMLVLITLFFYLMTNGAILLPMNVSSLISQNAYVFILATGMLLCILTGGNIDLSVGSVVCFTGAVGAVMMAEKGVNMVVCILAMIGLGILIGAIQGFWIAYVRIPPFIVTLAGMLIFRGLSNVVLNGMTISINDKKSFVNLFGGGADCYIKDIFGNENFNVTCFLIGIISAVIFCASQIISRAKKTKNGIDTGKAAAMYVKCILVSAVIIAFSYLLAKHKGIPTVLIWVAIVVAIYTYVTENTVVGRHFYAVGGNEKATKLSGINTNKVYFLAYLNMGFLSALAGMVTIARLNSAQPTYGQNYEMDAIASCFIGGASAYGGIGTVPGAIIGAVLMGVINLGMSLMSVDQNWQKVVKGLVLLLAVIFDVVSKRNGKLIAKN